MNYLKLFTAASGLFPKKIKVKLIDSYTGGLLHHVAIPAQQLPDAFNKPSILEINDMAWRVLKAEPVSADDFLFKKRLTLYVRPASGEGGKLQKYDLPTLCSDLPLTDSSCLFNDFTLELCAGEWRQIEFVSTVNLDKLSDEINKVEEIVSSQAEPLLGYEQQYTRLATEQLYIGWNELCSLLGKPTMGNISIDKQGFVRNGFALRNDNYTYYGILENGFVSSLCLTYFEAVDDEFMQILDTFKVALVDWCNARTLSAELGEAPKSEFVDL